jgi:FtsP/CotA-like multicopper oxidase with cupredoxin domain
MNRRELIAKSAAAAALGAPFPAKHNLRAQASADVHLEIAPLTLEIAPGKHVETIAYNGQVPGPLIRWPEGKPIAIDVTNRTNIPEIVHWHGLWIPSSQVSLPPAKPYGFLLYDAFSLCVSRPAYCW